LQGDVSGFRRAYVKRMFPRFFVRKQASLLNCFSQSAIVLLDDCVAFTSEVFEFLAVHNPYGAASIANDLLPGGPVVRPGGKSRLPAHGIWRWRAPKAQDTGEHCTGARLLAHADSFVCPPGQDQFAPKCVTTGFQGFR
jgi:hypothetical protein